MTKEVITNQNKRTTIYISYSTPAYRGMMKALRFSMLSVDISADHIDFCHMNDGGSWSENVKRKTNFFIQKHEEYAKQPNAENANICWIDSDALVLPTAYETTGIGLPFIEQFSSDIGIAFEYNNIGQNLGFLANTVVWNANDKMLELLRRWDWFCARTRSRTPVQTSFNEMWAMWGKEQCISHRELPAEYVYFDEHRHRPPYNAVKPIILHSIASRIMVNKK
jgi:hypothetical protein